MDKLMQEAPQFFRAQMYKQDSEMSKEHLILVLETAIAGMQYYIENEEDQERLDNLKPGDELLLYREPDNKYDKWAIAVYITEDDKVGHISRFKNEAIARMMDAGKKFVAIVNEPVDLEKEKGKSKEEKMRERRATTENIELPFSIYLVEDN